MTPKRKPLSGLARLLKSHLRLLRVHRGQIQELGELRKAILDMRQSVNVLRRMAQETRELMAQRTAPQEFDVPPPKQWTTKEIGEYWVSAEDLGKAGDELNGGVPWGGRHKLVP